MATVGELSKFLRCFDASLPLQILVTGGGGASELLDLTAMDLLGPAVARVADDPMAIWLVARRCDDLCVDALPESIVVGRPGCGCPLTVPVVLDRPVATWAIECAHSTSASSR